MKWILSTIIAGVLAGLLGWYMETPSTHAVVWLLMGAFAAVLSVALVILSSEP
jgi:LytS/YehU family sensor histidine kinase